MTFDRSGRPGPEPLTDPRAQRVRQVAALAGRSARDRSGRFLVEGPQAVREAVRCAAASVRTVYLSDEAAQRYPEIERDARAAGRRVRRGTSAVLDAMSGDAQGVVAVADRLGGTLGAVLAGGPRLVALLAHVRDPGNAGTVIRVADAMGADAVVLSAGSVDVHNPKVVRATTGSLFHLPVVAGAALPEVMGVLRGAGLTVLAADGAGAVDLNELLDAASGRGGGTAPGPTVPDLAAPDSTVPARVVPDLAAPARVVPDSTVPARVVPDLAAPTAWLFGNEAWGLPDEALALVDAVVRVPLCGRAESLNLATAAAICLFASARAHR